MLVFLVPGDKFDRPFPNLLSSSPFSSCGYSHCRSLTKPQGLSGVPGRADRTGAQRGGGPPAVLIAPTLLPALGRGKPITLQVRLQTSLGEARRPSWSPSGT